MAWVVWKYELVEGTVEHRMPEGAWVLSVREQNNRIMLWACVNPHETFQKPRRFHVVATGSERLENGGEPPAIFHGTVLLDGGEHVLHVFEEAQS